MIKSNFAFSGMSVDNLEKAKAFYVDTLHLPLQNENMGLTVELPGGGSLYLYEKSDHEPATYTAVNFVVENINDTIRHLTNDHGIQMLTYSNLPAPQDGMGVLRGKSNDMGPDIAWFADPAGNVISIIEN